MRIIGVRTSRRKNRDRTLTLAMFHFAGVLIGDTAYFLKAELLRTVRAAFWDGNALADGATTTKRANIFVSYCFYPDLLLRQEREKAFACALDELWLPWGGIASIAKKHPFFCDTDRGCEDPNQSYHHGDAWFFVNNYAASSLFEVNAEKFRPYIDALLAASTNDILWEGALLHLSDVSSADRYILCRFPAHCLSAAHRNSVV